MALLNKPFENNGIARLYVGIPSENFSEAILAGCSSKLAVLPATRVECNDWGEPSRVMATWAKIGRQPRYLTEQ